MSSSLASHSLTHSFICFSKRKSFGYLSYVNIHVCTNGTKSINKIEPLSGDFMATVKFGDVIGGLTRLGCALLEVKGYRAKSAEGKGTQGDV